VDFVDDPAVSDPQRALYAALEALDGPHEALRLPALPPETPTTDALFAERRATVSARQQLRRLQQGHSRSQPTRAARYLSRGRALAVSMLLQLRGG
jgi:hypothetical protein